MNVNYAYFYASMLSDDVSCSNVVHSLQLIIASCRPRKGSFATVIFR